MVLESIAVIRVGGFQPSRLFDRRTSSVPVHAGPERPAEKIVNQRRMQLVVTLRILRIEFDRATSMFACQFSQSAGQHHCGQVDFANGISRRLPRQFTERGDRLLESAVREMLSAAELIPAMYEMDASAITRKHERFLQR